MPHLNRYVLARADGVEQLQSETHVSRWSPFRAINAKMLLKLGHR